MTPSPLRTFRHSLGLILAAAALAAAQSAPRWIDLKIRNVDGANSCAGTGFRPEIKITNWGSEPFVLTQAVVRLFFNNPREQAIEFVNADFVRIFHPNGAITGTYATAFHFQGPPPATPCVATPARTANQRHFIAFSSLDGGLVTIPPAGGFATVVVSLRRAGGLAPFDLGCDDASKLVNQDPSRPFLDDNFFSLVESGGMGAPSVTICEFNGPGTQDPFTGNDICTNTTGCAAP